MPRRQQKSVKGGSDSAARQKKTLSEEELVHNAEDDPTLVLNKNFILGAATTSELRKRLSCAHIVLRALEQPADLGEVPWTDDFPEAIVSDTVLGHRDSQVKLYAACCLADALRINAPDCPFDDADVYKVFTTFVDQLKGVEDMNGDSFSTYFYLLEKLATVKAFILLTDPELEGEEIVTSLLTTCFEVISHEHPVKVETYMVDLIGAVIETSETIPEEWLEQILQYLVNPFKNDMVAAHRLARSLLERCSDQLVEPLNRYLRGCLKAVIESEKASKDDGAAKSSRSRKRAVGPGTGMFEVRSRLHELILELSTISSSLLLYVLPDIVAESQRSEYERRASTVMLLSQMFTAEGSALVEEYQQVFSEFLRRFLDVDPRIRMYMAKSSPIIIKRHPDSRTAVLAKLQERVLDTDEKTRLAAVDSVCQLAEQSLDMITEELFTAVCERTRDKKVAVRRDGIRRLAMLYRSYVDAYFNIPSSGDVTVEHIALQWPADVQHYMGQIAQTIVFAYTTDTDSGVRLVCEEALQNGMWPRNMASTVGMVSAFLCFYESLPEKSQRLFERLLTLKNRYRKLVSMFLSLRTELKASPTDEGIRSQLKQVVTALVRAHDDVEKGTTFWTEMQKVRDEKLFKMLKNVLDDHASVQDIRDAYAELIRHAKSTASPIVAEGLRTAVLKATFNLLSRDHLEVMWAFVDKALDDDLADHVDADTAEQIVAKATTALHALHDILAAFPSWFSESSMTVAQDVLNVYADCLGTSQAEDVAAFAEWTCRAVAHCADSVSEMEGSELVEQLLRVLVEGPSLKVAKYGTALFSQLGQLCSGKGNGNRHVVSLMDDLYPKLSVHTNISSVLVSLTQLAVLEAPTFRVHCSEIMDFVWQKLLCDSSPESADVQRRAALLAAAEQTGRPAESAEDESAREGIWRTNLWEWCEANLDSDDPDLVVAAAEVVLKLVSHPSAEAKGMSLDMFHQINRLSQLPDSELRRRIVKKLTKRVSSAIVSASGKKTGSDADVAPLRFPLRYVSWLLPYVVDSVQATAVQANGCLQAVLSWHGQWARSQSQIELQSPGAQTLYPEYILPFAVHALAHVAPERWVDHTKTFVHVQQCLFALLTTLMHTNNVSFIQSLLMKLKTYDDQLDPSSDRVRKVCDVALLVTHRVCEQHRLPLAAGTFPGDIFVPQFLFRRMGASADDKGKRFTLPTGFRLMERPRIGAPKKAEETTTDSESEDEDEMDVDAKPESTSSTPKKRSSPSEGENRNSRRRTSSKSASASWSSSRESAAEATSAGRAIAKRIALAKKAEKESQSTTATEETDSDDAETQSTEPEKENDNPVPSSRGKRSAAPQPARRSARTTRSTKSYADDASDTGAGVFSTQELSMLS